MSVSIGKYAKKIVTQKPKKRLPTIQEQKEQVIRKKVKAVGKKKLVKVKEVSTSEKDRDIFVYCKKEILNYMKMYSYVFPPKRKTFPEEKELWIFGKVYNEVISEMIVNIEEIESDKKFQHDTAVYINTELQKMDIDRTIPSVSTNIIEIFEKYNSFLSYLPDEYRKTRTELIIELQTYIRSSFYIRTLITRNYPLPTKEIMNYPNSIQTLARKYNKLNEQIFPQEQEYDEEKMIRNEEKKEKEEKGKNKQKKKKKVAHLLDKLEQKLDKERLREQVIIESEEKEDEKGPDTSAQVKRYIKNYRDDIKVDISKTKGISIEDVTDDDINKVIIQKENLPYWVCLANFYASGELEFNKYPEINPLFKKSFSGLLPTWQNRFISQLFSEYPTESYPNGPDKSIYSLYMMFINEHTTINQEDNILSIIGTDKFIDTVKSLDVPMLLHYRPIIFDNIDKLSEYDQSFILDKYNKLLSEPILTTLSVVKNIENVPIVMLIDSNTDTIIFPTNISFEIDFTDDDISLHVIKIIQPLINKYCINKSIKTVPEDEILIKEVYPNVLKFLEGYFNLGISVLIPYRKYILDYIKQDIKNFLDSFQNEKVLSLDAEAIKDTEKMLEFSRYNDMGELNYKELMIQANKLGFSIGKNIAKGKEKALDKLQLQLDADEISQREYDNAVYKIDSIVQAYNELETLNVDKALTIRRKEANRYYQDRVSEIVRDKETQLGKELSKVEIENIEDNVWNEIVEKGILTRTEINSWLSSKIPVIRKAIKQRVYKNISNVVKDMPEALKKSLQEMMDDLAKMLPQEGSNRDNEVRMYYKFITQIIIINSGQDKQKRSVADIMSEYPNIPEDFKQKILKLLKSPDVIGIDLIRLTTQYLTGNVKLLKNPLRKSGNRRKLRYDKLFSQISTQGKLSIMKKVIPDIIPPHIKECIMYHYLKPWLDIPNITSWNYVVALKSGNHYADMSSKEREYFNLPTGNGIALYLDNHWVHFYKPSTKYWIQHCTVNHTDEKDSLSCNTSSLIKHLSISSDTNVKDKFYELIYKEPITYFDTRGTGRNKTLYIDYQKDEPDKLILISADPNNYQKECDWFASRTIHMDTLVKSVKESFKISDDMRKTVILTISKVLKVLKFKFNIEASQEEISDQSQALEKEIYIHTEPRTVYNYLFNIYSFLEFIDPEKILGSRTSFFPGLVAFASKSYYPVILSQYLTYADKLPEIFYDKKNNSDILSKVSNYIEQSIQLEIENFILKILQPSIPRLDITNALALNTTKINNIAVALPESSGLKNICINADDYKGENNLNLVYYKSGDNIYCISKLELSNMALTRNYTFNKVKFDPNFVDQFKLYSRYTVEEISLQNKYMKAIIAGLFSNIKNLNLVDKLIDMYIAKGNTNLTFADLQIVKFFNHIQLYDTENKWLIDSIINKVNELIRTEISNRILDIGDIFIKNNKQQLKDLLKSQVSKYQQMDPTAFGNLTTVQRFMEINKYENFILETAISVVIKHIENESKYTVSNIDKAIIGKHIQDIAYEPENIVPQTMLCEECKNIISEPLYIGQPQDDKFGKSNKPYPVVSSIVQTRNDLDIKNKLVHFCSGTCFSRYKVKEPTKEDVDLARIQIAIDKLTEPFIDYIQMLLLAKYPSQYKIPSDPVKQYEAILNIAQKNGISKEKVFERLNTIPGNDSALAIPVVNIDGKSLSQTELWDRIRTNIYFLLPITELLKKDKYEALQYLARKFSVYMKNFTYEEAVSYYTANPEILQAIWLQIRKNPTFITAFKTVIKSFNPNEIDSIEKINKLIPIAEERQPDIFENIEQRIYKILSHIKNLKNIILELDEFKTLREKIFFDIISNFPTVSLRINNNSRKYLNSYKKTLEYLFQKQRNAIIEMIPLNDPRQPSIPTDAMNENMFMQESVKFCKDIQKTNNPHFQITSWLKNLINKTKITGARISSEQVFYMFVKRFTCSRFQEISNQLSTTSINIERVNSIIDDTIAKIIDRNSESTKANLKPLDITMRVDIKLDQDIDEKEFINDLYEYTKFPIESINSSKKYKLKDTDYITLNISQLKNMNIVDIKQQIEQFLDKSKYGSIIAPTKRKNIKKRTATDIDVSQILSSYAVQPIVQQDTRSTLEIIKDARKKIRNMARGQIKQPIILPNKPLNSRQTEKIIQQETKEKEKEDIEQIELNIDQEQDMIPEDFEPIIESIEDNETEDIDDKNVEDIDEEKEQDDYGDEPEQEFEYE